MGDDHGRRVARSAGSRAMTEDELYAGITDALTLAGWRWLHMIRSDGVVTGTGAEGWPDIFAVHPARDQVLVWELKGDRGRPTLEQAAWISSLGAVAIVQGARWLDVRVVYPDDYDVAVDLILGRRDRWPL